MKLDKLDPRVMKQALDPSLDPVFSSEAHQKITQAIAQRTTEKPKGFNFFEALFLNPRLALFLLLPVAAVLFSLLFLLPGTGGGQRALISYVSGNADVHDGSREALVPGDSLLDNPVILTGENQTGDFQINENTRFRVFSSSQVAVAQNENRIVLELKQGSLYFNRHSLSKIEKTVVVKLQDYEFTLLGTRVLFQNWGEQIRAFCYDGMVQVALKSDQVGRELFTLTQGEKIEIQIDQSKRRYHVDNFLAENEAEFDKQLKDFPSMGDVEVEIYEPILSRTAEREKDVQADIKINNTEKIIKPRIVELGQLSAAVDFSLAVPGEDKIYLVSDKSLYSLKSGKLSMIRNFGEKAYFKAAPAMLGLTLCLISTTDVYLFNIKTDALVHTIPLPDRGFIEDQCRVLVRDNDFLIPVLNKGYYSLNPQLSNPRLELVFEELFPLSPTTAKGGVLLGSVYEKTLVYRDASGKVLWQKALEGRFALNPLAFNNGFVLVVQKAQGPELQVMDFDGNIVKQKMLDFDVSGELLVENNFVIGFYKDGRVFSFDLATGALEVLFSPFENALDRKIAMGLKPVVQKGVVYCGSSSGSLIQYSLKDRVVQSDVFIEKALSFITPPVLFDDNVYLFSRSGKILSVVRSE